METPASIARHPIHPILIMLIAISGWLGGEMVHVHGVGVAGIPAPIDDVGDHQATHTGPSATRLGPT